MADSGNRLTGEWVGYYKQRGRQRGISASIVQDGDQISGTMTDTETDVEVPLPDAVREAALPPGADETIDKQVREAIPGETGEKVRAKSVLPSESSLSGTVDGNNIWFVKAYQGQHFVGYRLGEKAVGQVIEQHSVEYFGQVLKGGTVIEGRWVICESAAPAALSQGSFRLQKS